MRIRLGDSFIDLACVSYISPIYTTNQTHPAYPPHGGLVCITAMFYYHIDGHKFSHEIHYSDRVMQDLNSVELNVKASELIEKLRPVYDDLVAKWLAVKGDYSAKDNAS